MCDILAYNLIKIFMRMQYALNVFSTQITEVCVE